MRQATSPTVCPQAPLWERKRSRSALPHSSAMAALALSCAMMACQFSPVSSGLESRSTLVLGQRLTRSFREGSDRKSCGFGKLHKFTQLCSARPLESSCTQAVHQQVCVAMLSELGLWVLKYYLHILSPCHKALFFPLPGLCNCGNVNCKDQS